MASDVQYEQDNLVITMCDMDGVRKKPHFEEEEERREGERAKKAAARFLHSPLPLFHRGRSPLLLPSHSQVTFMHFPFYFTHTAFPPLLFPPNDVLVHKLCVSLLLSFSTKVVSYHIIPMHFGYFLFNQPMSPHILSP